MQDYHKFLRGVFEAQDRISIIRKDVLSDSSIIPDSWTTMYNNVRKGVGYKVNMIMFIHWYSYQEAKKKKQIESGEQ